MTTLDDIVSAAQERCDRANADTISTAEWYGYVNASAAALYRKITRLYEDYNATVFQFTLQGGVGNNILQLGPGTACPDFYKLRGVSRQINANAVQWVPITKVDSHLEFDMLTAPTLNPYFGSVLVQYFLAGNTLEFRPAASAGATYAMLYIPQYKKLVNGTDSIDGQWLSQSGIDEWIVVDVARKAFVKEESIDSAALLAAEANAMADEIMKDLAPRDDNQPGKIADVKRIKASWGIYGFGGPWS